MRYQLTAEIPWPPADAYRVMRDEMHRVALWLPRLDGVHTVARELRGADVVQTRAWRVTRDALPAIAQALTSRTSLGWRDESVWREADLSCAWTNIPEDWPEAVTAKGVFRFEEERGDTVLVVEGELVLHPSKLPKLPPGLAEKSLPALERFAFEAARPHFEELARAVARYLEEG